MRKPIATVLMCSLLNGCYAIQIPTIEEKKLVSKIHLNPATAAVAIDVIPSKPSKYNIDSAIQLIDQINISDSTTSEPPIEKFYENIEKLQTKIKLSTPPFRRLFLHPDYRSTESFCRNIIIFAGKASSNYATGGYILGIGGLLGAAALTSIAAHDAQETIEKTGIQGSTAGYSIGAASFAAITAIGIYLITRSAAAQKARNHAAQALSEPNPSASPGPNDPTDKMFTNCVKARVDWVDANADGIVKVIPSK